MKRLAAMAGLLICWTTACAGAQVVPSPQKLEGAGDWSYVLVPPARGEEKAPLVIALHGYEGDARSMARLWSHLPNMSRVWVLAPQAPKKNKSGKSVSTWQAGKDDVFLHSLLDHVEKTASVDRQRVALVGYSAGAAMAVHMAMSNPGRFAACAAVGGGAGMSGSVKPGFTHFFFLAGAEDRGFSPDQARGIAERFTAEGGRAAYDVVPGVDHASLYAKVEPAAAWLARELSLVTRPTIEP